MVPAQTAPDELLITARYVRTGSLRQVEVTASAGVSTTTVDYRFHGTVLSMPKLGDPREWAITHVRRQLTIAQPPNADAAIRLLELVEQPIQVGFWHLAD